jgi:hypothetical protein
VTACASESEICEQYEKCGIRDPLWRIKERILAALATCTVHELATEPEAESAPGAARPIVLYPHP